MKDQTASDIKDIKGMIGTKKWVIGEDRVIKSIRLGKLSKVWLASNCSEKTSQDIDYYGKLANTEVIRLKMPNDELGILCKKPFSISVLGQSKDAK